MIKFIKAVVVGYIALWAFDWLRKSFGDDGINSIDDVKTYIKNKL